MNTEQMTKYQTDLVNLGMGKKYGPPSESQDPADHVLFRYLIANTGRSLFSKMNDAAKDALVDLIGPVVMQKVRDASTKNGASHVEEVVRSENYSCTLRINAPSKGKINGDRLLNYLISMNAVDPKVLQEAVDQATDYPRPAEYYTVVPSKAI
jgi:hypothetical protein